VCVEVLWCVLECLCVPGVCDVFVVCVFTVNVRCVYGVCKWRLLCVYVVFVF